MQIHQCNVSIDDVLRECHGIKRACQNRELEISSLMSANQEIEAKNQQLDQSNRSSHAKVTPNLCR